MIKFTLTFIAVAFLLPHTVMAALPHGKIYEMHEDKGYLDKDYVEKKYLAEVKRYKNIRNIKKKSNKVN